MLSLVAIARTDISEERIASIIKVTRIGELCEAGSVSMEYQIEDAERSGAAGDGVGL
jgi:hypothetical protein